MTINIVVIITINNRLFSTHTHACEFMTSKTLWHKIKMTCHDKYWCHKFKTHKNLWCHEKSWIAMKTCDTLLPNRMACHHHMEDRVDINCKGQQYFQLANK
jgi:hypothetical protein